jgi:ABC-type antimicrobial peptide transport system permease subunit
VLRALGARRAVVLRLALAEATTLALTGAAIGTACGFMLASVDTVMLRVLAGLPVKLTIPFTAIAIGWLVHLTVTLAVALPGMLGVLRATPSEMVAGGRNE